MTDVVSSEKRSQMMAGIKGKNTKPEIAIRKALFAFGLRYRIHDKRLPGKPDLVFPRRKAVVFVEGCFWHQHAEADCRRGRAPRSNLGYWRPKLNRNVERDAEAIQNLTKLGWSVLTLWECEIGSDSDLTRKICDFLR